MNPSRLACSLAGSLAVVIAAAGAHAQAPDIHVPHSLADGFGLLLRDLEDGLRRRAHDAASAVSASPSSRRTVQSSFAEAPRLS